MKDLIYVENDVEHVGNITYDAKPKYCIPLLTEREMGWLLTAIHEYAGEQAKLAHETLSSPEPSDITSPDVVNETISFWKYQERNNIHWSNKTVCDNLEKMLWWVMHHDWCPNYKPEEERLIE
jgi:hypothetical protein